MKLNVREILNFLLFYYFIVEISLLILASDNIIGVTDLITYTFLNGITILLIVILVLEFYKFKLEVLFKMRQEVKEKIEELEDLVLDLKQTFKDKDLEESENLMREIGDLIYDIEEYIRQLKRV